MASRTFSNPHQRLKAALLYNNQSATEYRTVLDLQDNINNYNFLFIVFYNGTPGYSTRGYMYLPSIGLDAGLGSYSCTAGNEQGYLRFEKPSPNQLNVYAGSFQTLYITQIYGLY